MSGPLRLTRAEELGLDLERVAHTLRDIMRRRLEDGAWICADVSEDVELRDRFTALMHEVRALAHDVAPELVPSPEEWTRREVAAFLRG